MMRSSKENLSWCVSYLVGELTSCVKDVEWSNRSSSSSWVSGVTPGRLKSPQIRRRFTTSIPKVVSRVPNSKNDYCSVFNARLLSDTQNQNEIHIFLFEICTLIQNFPLMFWFTCIDQVILPRLRFDFIIWLPACNQIEYYYYYLYYIM